MLATLENIIAEALQLAMPSVSVFTGPSTGPAADETERLEVAAERLDIKRPAEPSAVQRSASCFTSVQLWSADGTQQDFGFSPFAVASSLEQVLEVEAPRGCRQLLGSDLSITGATLTFLGRLPPAQDEGVIARVRGSSGPIVAEERWRSDGKTSQFVLSPSLVDAALAESLVDVEAPRGRLRSRGDDFLLEGAQLRFREPPQAGAQAVAASLRGAPAVGYEETCAARLTMAFIVWASTSARMTELAEMALLTALSATADLRTLETVAGANQARVQLLRPFAELESLLRATVVVGSRRFFTTRAVFRVSGDLRTSVTLATATPAKLIKQVLPSVTEASPR